MILSMDTRLIPRQLIRLEKTSIPRVIRRGLSWRHKARPSRPIWWKSDVTRQKHFGTPPRFSVVAQCGVTRHGHDPSLQGAELWGGGAKMTRRIICGSRFGDLFPNMFSCMVSRDLLLLAPDGTKTINVPGSRGQIQPKHRTLRLIEHSGNPADI